MPAPDALKWSLDPSITFLNHGSFGATPRAVLEDQTTWRMRLEAEPVLFLDRELPGLLAEARLALGAVLGGDEDDLAFVSNATTGINAVLRSLRFSPGDELLATDHEYNATLNALREVAERDRARVVIARVPFPVRSPAEVIDAVVGATTSRTRLALVSHVTSPTAAIFPIRDVVRELQGRGVDVLVDAAHAPGMVAFDLDETGAAYTAGNLHKWLCAPKGSGFLHVRRDRRHLIRPVVISHGANGEGAGHDRFRAEFDWTGTGDPTPYLAVPAAIRLLESLRPGGLAALITDRRALTLAVRDRLCEALGVAPPLPDSMVGTMTAIPLPADFPADLQAQLFDRHRIEVPVAEWPVRAAREDGRQPLRLLRVSVAPYTDLGDVERLVDALEDLRLAGLGRQGRPASVAGRITSAE